MNTATPTSAPAALPATSGRLSNGAALGLVSSMVITFLAASSAPSPLVAGLYREACFGADATLVFSSYAFALLASLLVFGRLSDHRGRRAVILGALVIEFVSVVLFWQAQSVTWLFAARIVQGVATGIATSVLSAMLLDLDRVRGAFINSVTPMFGMALGALGTSLLVQFAPAPTVLVFEGSLAGVRGADRARVAPARDRVAPPGAWRSMAPQVAVPAAARSTLLRVLPSNTAQWALGGFYLSLGPTLARQVTDTTAPVVGGALIATLVLSGAVAIALVRNRPPRDVLELGALGLAVGLAITLGGVVSHSAGLLFSGTLIAGLGFGAGFNGSVRSLAPLAEPHERGALMSSFFAASYLAFAVPAIAAGLFVGYFGLKTTAIGYAAVLVALAGGALAEMRRSRRVTCR